MMRVKINVTKSYSGRGGYPSGPYYGYELISMGFDAIEPGTILATSKGTHLERRDAIAAAKTTIKRKGRGLWVLTTNAGEQPSITGAQ